MIRTLHSFSGAILSGTLFCSSFCFAQNAWWQENSQTFSSLRNINFADMNAGWFFGDSAIGPVFKRGIIKKTLNQGLNWSMQFMGSDSIQILSSHVFNTNTVIAVGKFQTTGDGAIIKTINGGTSWTRDTTSFAERLFDVDFADVNTGWVTGRNGYLSRTNNGGTSWATQVTGTGEDLFALDFVSLNYGWAVGADPGFGGTIIRTLNGGNTYTTQTNTAAGDLFDIKAFSATTAIAVGAGGVIVATSDSGNTWVVRNSGTINDLFSVSFTDAMNGWAAGASGTIIITTDGGISWNPQASNSTNNIHCIHMNNLGLGWYCGDGGNVYFYGTSPVSSGDEPTHSIAIILWPNPVASTLFIRISGSHHALYVMDATGRGIQTILTKENEVALSPSNLAAGAYFLAVRFDSGEVRTLKFFKQ